MALINCPECGKEISTTAETCPNCGYSIKKKKKWILPTTLIALTLAIGVLLCVFLIKPSSDNSIVKNDLESKAFLQYGTETRSSLIKIGKEVANAFMSYAKKNFKNPSSIQVEQAYSGGSFYLLDISAENSFGGRERDYYLVSFGNEYKVDKPIAYNSYLAMSYELKGDDFEWFSSLFK